MAGIGWLLGKYERRHFLHTCNGATQLIVQANARRCWLEFSYNGAGPLRILPDKIYLVSTGWYSLNAGNQRLKLTMIDDGPLPMYDWYVNAAAGQLVGVIELLELPG